MYNLVSINSIFPHKETDFSETEIIESSFENDNFIERALLVDLGSNVLIAGHHRLRALKDLNYSLAPVIFIDYLNDNLIELKINDRIIKFQLSKEELINRALNRNLLPYKSTNHNYNINTQCNLKLNNLI